MKRIHVFLFFSFLLSTAWTGNKNALKAQVNVICDNAIDEATELFNNGKYDDCLQYIKNTLSSCKFAKTKKTKLYELMINANLEKDSLQGIDEGFKKLLANDPLYTLEDYNGLDEFSTHFSNYYVSPKFGIGIRVYYAMPSIKSNSTYMVLPGTNTEAAYQTSNIINAGLFFDYRLLEKLGLCLDGGYFKLNYKRELNNESWKLNYNEEFSIVDFNLSLRYFLKTNKALNYNFSGGLGNQYMLSSTMSFDQEKNKFDVYTDAQSTENSTLSKFNSENIRNKYIYSILLGAGINYRIGVIGIGLEGRFQYALNYLNDPQTRFFEPSLIKNYNYLDNDMRVSKFDLAITLSYYLKLRVKNKKNV